MSSYILCVVLSKSINGVYYTFLECENKPKLLDFYHLNGFKEISIRNTKEDKNLIQLYKMI